MIPGLEMLLPEWWTWTGVLFGILGGGSAGLNPFSRDFAERKQGGTASNVIPAPDYLENVQTSRLSKAGRVQMRTIEDIIRQAQAPVNYSNLSLSDEDMNTLNQAYAGSEAAVRRFGQLMGQDLAGTRGLNPSDTPVSEAVLRETLPIIAQLQDQRAQQQLGLGLNMRQMNEGARQFNLGSLITGAQLTPTASLGLAGHLQRNRLFQNTQTQNQWGYGSPLDNMEQGSRIYSKVMNGSAGFAAMSDRRLKRDIAPVSWKWKHGSDHTYLGVIAQDVEKHHPHLTSRDVHGNLMVDYGTMVAMLLDEREHLYAQLASQ